MPRLPRFNLVGVPQHVIQRGNNRHACFFTEEDYEHYLDCLRDAADRQACDIHAYVLMTNHVHLLVTPQRPDAISRTMQSVGRRYVQYVNHMYQRTGTLWEGRYRASLVESERYVLSCYRYIELNPVRAAMVNHPGEYRWSSYSANAQGKGGEWLIPHDEYRRLDKSTEARQKAYRELFRAALAPGEIHEIRQCVNQGVVLGGEQFREQIEKAMKIRTVPGRRGRPLKSKDE